MPQRTRGLIIGLSGESLTAKERALLAYPCVSGVLLLTHNFKTEPSASTLESVGDLKALRFLTDTIRAARVVCGDADTFLISADFECIDVWRARNGAGVPWSNWVQPEPLARTLGLRFEEGSPEERLALLEEVESYAYTLGQALLSVGINMNYVPLLDSHHEHSLIIGKRGRAFSQEPEVIKALARAHILGFKKAGVHCVGKHFPDHGWAQADSHLSAAEDTRSLEALEQHLVVYKELIEDGLLDYIMTAHVRYPAVDEAIASRSPVWHQRLRSLGFSGEIISDCMTMKGSGEDDVWERLSSAFDAGANHIILGGLPPHHPLHSRYPALETAELEIILKRLSARAMDRSEHVKTDSEYTY